MLHFEGKLSFKVEQRKKCALFQATACCAAYTLPVVLSVLRIGEKKRFNLRFPESSQLRRNYITQIPTVEQTCSVSWITFMSAHWEESWISSLLRLHFWGQKKSCILRSRWLRACLDSQCLHGRGTPDNLLSPESERCAIDEIAMSEQNTMENCNENWNKQQLIGSIRLRLTAVQSLSY